MGYHEIVLGIDGPIATITLNRPDARNAMTAAMGEEVARAVMELNRATEVRAVLLRGAGKGFSAGGDFRYLEERIQKTPEENRDAMVAFYRSFLSIADLRAPSIAVIHGAAIGAGLCIALACDLRLAATDARLGATFVKLGLHPGMGGTYFLPRIVGLAKARELLYTGREIDGVEAERIGLVDAAHPPEALEEKALALAHEIAAAAPIAVAQTKASLQHSLEHTLPEMLEAEAAAQAVDYRTADMAEGVAAIRERRAPRFSGM